MKLLTLSMNRLELARLQLRKPLIVVGRSPTCDVVLRAQDIKPIHFIIEWIGNGKFNPKAGQWSIVDVSSNAEAGAGLVLGKNPLLIGDISFVCIESDIESTEVIGGKIVDNLSSSHGDVPDLLEFVQVRNDSGAIEEVRHLALPKRAKAESISKEFKAFKVERPKMATEHLLNVVLEELPGAELMLSGRKIEPTSRVPLGANDFLQVKWNGRDFYLRFVDEVQSPPIPRDFWGDPLLKKMTLVMALLFALLIGLRAAFNTPHAAEEVPPVRVARIEIPAPPPRPVEPEAKPVVEEQKPAKVDAAVEKVKVVTTPGKAGASKVVSSPTAKPKAGLNIKAPVADVNKLGILGALTKNTNKGAGIKAENIINNGLIQEAVTGKGESRIVVANPPAGVIGKGAGGAPNGKTTDSLGSASTTLQGVKSAAPNSQSLIARAGGSGNSKLGSSLEGIGTSVAGNGDAVKLGDGAGDFSVSGGLDKETVRRIIQSYRAQIRACYERALISSPNLQGRISYQWKILSDGGVVDAKVAKSTVESANLKACVLEVINQMQFPKSSRGLSTTVIYPFQFQGLK